MNTTLDPIPNALGAAFLTVADARTALRTSLDAWNDIPTSFIDMRITGTIANPGLSGFDMRNELTFRTGAGFAAIASSPSVSLIEDVTLLHGEDIDGDGDVDVSNAIAVATDADGDGDIEFPAGFYKAGTLLDNDVQFNTKVSNGFRFTVDPAAVDTTTRSVDLMAVAVHEFGHSFGLSHTLDNQYSATDGNGTSMFPFIDTGDPASELSQRTLESDDVAWASCLYGEGTAVSQLFILPNVADSILDGTYVIPVPKGSYAVGVEAIDGGPVPVTSVSFTAQIGAVFGQLNFSEEFYNRNQEDAVEVRPGQATNVVAHAGHITDLIDIVTTKNININNFGDLNFVGFANSPAGRYYAVRIPASQITAAAAPSGGKIVFHSASFETFVLDASVPVIFAEATLTTGSVSGANALINLTEPLARVTGFLGQDGDFAPFYLPDGHDLGKQVMEGIADGSITDLFMLLRIPTTTPYPGVSGQPPLIGLDGVVTTPPSNDVPILGLSYVSSDGGVTFTRNTTFNLPVLAGAVRTVRGTVRRAGEILGTSGPWLSSVTSNHQEVV